MLSLVTAAAGAVAIMS